MNRFAMGGAMGFLIGAGIMMMPASSKLKRTMKKEAEKMKRIIRQF